MSNRRLATIAVLAALGLAGCASAEGDSDAKATPIPVVAASDSAAPTETPTPEPTTPEPTETSVYGESVTSERGYLVKQLGQIAGTTTESGETLMQFSVTAIQPNFQCTSEYSEQPENGNFIAITLDVQTTAALAQVEEMPYYNMSAWDFRVIGPDGTRENDSTGSASMCLDSSEALPSEIGPGEHVVGTIVLDSKYTSGALAFVPAWIAGGWEWVF